MTGTSGDLGNDADHLLVDLADAIGTDSLQYADRPVRLTGGFFATVVRFRLADPPAAFVGPLVARLMPDNEPAHRESEVQRLVAQTGFSTPMILASGDDSGALGQAWSVMVAVDGSPMIGDLDPKTILRVLPELVRLLPGRLASMASSLHAVSPPELQHVAPFRMPTESVVWLESELDPDVGGRARGNELFVEELRRAALGLRRATSDDHSFSGTVGVLCHGDLHPLNVLTAADGTDVLIDWSDAVWSTPEYELAYTTFIVGHPPLDLPPLVMKAVQAALRPLGARIVTEYVKTSGRSIDRRQLKWWTGFHALRMLSHLAHGDATIRNHPWFGLQEALVAEVARATGVVIHRRVT